MEISCALNVAYRGRLAPSPTGYMHLGHARTFWVAQQRAREVQGILIFRNEDLDRARATRHFAEAMVEDLRWLGLTWTEGPDCGGSLGPYDQSQRLPLYRAAFEKLRRDGFVYPCYCSRQDVLHALAAPHAGEDEPVYPGTCRPVLPRRTGDEPTSPAPATSRNPRANWRFRVPDDEVIGFLDGWFGRQTFIAGRDFGDFVVWRHDDLPAYQLAVVVDDSTMRVTEVVRGEDLVRSTARQLLIYRALGYPAPAFFHCPLVRDETGNRLAKRHDALSLRSLRSQGQTPHEVVAGFPALAFKRHVTKIPD